MLELALTLALSLQVQQQPWPKQNDLFFMGMEPIPGPTKADKEMIPIPKPSNLPGPKYLIFYTHDNLYNTISQT